MLWVTAATAQAGDCLPRLLSRALSGQLSLSMAV